MQRVFTRNSKFEGNEQYEKIEREVKILVFANEDLFNNLKFNLTIDKFIDSQNTLIASFQKKQRLLSSESKNLLILALIVLVIFCFGISFIISKSVIGPIVKLKEAVWKVRKGQFDSKIEIMSKDETGLLAQSFNNMVEELGNSMTSISSLTEIQCELAEVNQRLENTNREYQKVNK